MPSSTLTTSPASEAGNTATTDTFHGAPLVQVETIHQLNSLNETNKLKEGWELATKTLEDHPAWDHFELTWRLGRALFRYGMDVYAEGSSEHKALILASVKLMEKAEEDAKDELKTSFSFNYIIACALGKAGDYLGKNEKIANAYIIRDYLKTSISVDPEQPGPYHALGQWCFQVASIGYLERLAAKTLFATPPTSTYEEALDNFKTAYGKSGPSERTYILNMVKIGNTYKAMKNKTEAREWYQKAMKTESKSGMDKTAQKDAAAMLKKL